MVSPIASYGINFKNMRRNFYFFSHLCIIFREHFYFRLGSGSISRRKFVTISIRPWTSTSIKIGFSFFRLSFIDRRPFMAMTQQKKNKNDDDNGSNNNIINTYIKRYVEKELISFHFISSAYQDMRINENMFRENFYLVSSILLTDWTELNWLICVKFLSCW